MDLKMTKVGIMGGGVNGDRDGEIDDGGDDNRRDTTSNRKC